MAKFAPAWLSRPFDVGACAGAYALLAACALNTNSALSIAQLSTPEASRKHCKPGAMTLVMQTAVPHKPCRPQSLEVESQRAEC